MNESIELVVVKLEELARAIGLGAQQLWPYLVRQQYLIAIKGLMCSLLLVGWILIVKKYLPRLIKYGKENNWDEAWIPVSILAIVLSVLFLVLGLEGIGNAFRIINPEYYAFRDIVGMLQSTVAQ